MEGMPNCDVGFCRLKQLRMEVVGFRVLSELWPTEGFLPPCQTQEQRIRRDLLAARFSVDSRASQSQLDRLKPCNICTYSGQT